MRLGIALTVVLGVLASIAAARWPFTVNRITRSIESATASRAKIGNFRRTFFPPGCVAEEVSIFRDSGPPLATVRTITIRDSWFNRLRLSHRVNELRAEEVRVAIPDQVPPAIEHGDDGGTNSTVGVLIGDGAVLEFERADEPLRFEFPELELRELARDKQIGFRIVARHPIPPGDLRTHGAFGPWNSSDPGRTPLNGTFEFKNADLGRIPGIAGRLFSKGRFEGGLRNIAVRGEANVNEFRVSRNPRPVHLQTAYQCAVNALNGDVFLKEVEAGFLGTKLRVQGRVANENGQEGKTATLNFQSTTARIQDLLRLFTSSPRPALAGPMVLGADVVAPPGDEPFLEKVRLNGRFTISNAEFTKDRTQGKVEEFSSRAQGDEVDEEKGEQPEPTVSEIKGKAVLRDGLARLSDLAFRVPGAVATGAGTYHVITKRVDIKGSVSMEATLSDATSGIKSLLLKPIEVFLRKNREGGSVVPVSLTGTSSKPVFRLHLKRNP